MRFKNFLDNWILIELKGSSGWDCEWYGQLNIEQMMVMARVNEVQTVYLDWNTSVLFRAAERLKCRTVDISCVLHEIQIWNTQLPTQEIYTLYFCDWIPEFRPLGTNQVSLQKNIFRHRHLHFFEPSLPRFSASSQLPGYFVRISEANSNFAVFCCSCKKFSSKDKVWSLAKKTANK